MAESQTRSFGGACQAPGLFDFPVLIPDSSCSRQVFLLAIFYLAVKLICCHGVNGCVNSPRRREGIGTGAH